jgi:predicted metal-dependent HD superfamily phosphohydrolase
MHARTHTHTQVMLSNQWTLDEIRFQVDSAWAGVAARAGRWLFPPAAAGPPADEDPLARRWREASDAVGADRAASTAWYRRLWLLHAGRSRFYHGLAHVQEALEAAEAMAAGGVAVARPAAVALALFFHDAVYEPARGDNEEASARLFLDFAAAAAPALPPADRDAAAAWIRRTAAHHAGPPAAGDLAVVLDADLAVLGAPAARYARYAEGIRREYAHLPEAEFVRARARVLEGLLGQERLFCTPWAAGRLDAPARANLRRELGRLRAAEGVYAPA